MSDPQKDDGKVSVAEENSMASFSDARFCPSTDIFQSIQPGNVRRLVEKFRRLGEQALLSKPYGRSSCARKVPGSLSEGHAHRSVSFRKKELLAARKKSDRWKRNRALDEKRILLTPNLFSPGDIISSSVSISHAVVDRRRLSRFFGTNCGFERLGLVGQLPSLIDRDQEVEAISSQISDITVDKINNSTDDNGSDSLSEKIGGDVVPEEIYLDATSVCLEDKTLLVQKSDVTSGDDLGEKVDDDCVRDEIPDDEPKLQAVSPSHSEISESASSSASASKDNADCDEGVDLVVENSSETRRNADGGDEKEFEKANDVSENVYKNNSIYEEIEIDPKLWVCRDRIPSSPSADGLDCDRWRLQRNSIYSVFNNSVDSFDSDLTDYDVIHRNECHSLPAQINCSSSKNKQENEYLDFGPVVRSLPVDSSTFVVDSVNDSKNIYVNRSGVAGTQSEARELAKQHRVYRVCEGHEYEEYDFNCRTSRDECPYNDEEHIYDECDFTSQSRDSSAYVTVCHEVCSTDMSSVHFSSKDRDSSNDDSRKSRLSDDFSYRDSTVSSVYDSVSSCSEFRDSVLSEADYTQNLIFEPVNKLERIKAELVETERKYIDRLWLINGEFRMALMSWNEENELLPPEAFHQMFLNVDVIYKLHSVFFLPALEDCIKSEENKRIEDVFLKNADFLKLYAEYSCNFDSAMKAIEMWKTRFPEFNKMIQEIQRKPVCQSLTLEHHMLEPIQRIPRYKLLLSSYLENLPKESPEYEKTKKALVKVSAAANHCDNFFESLEKFRKVLDVQQSLWNKMELLTPSRELILSGRMKVTQQQENDEEKHLFLFSDTLLVCKKFPPGISPPYKLTLQLEIGGMQVIDRKKQGNSESFFVISRQGYLEMHPSSLEVREKWILALQTVISNYTAQETSRTVKNSKNPGNGVHRQKSIPGRQAPIWIKDPHANRCMQCDESFNAIRRRHHCRACGIVVCGKCSNKQIPLEFDGFSQNHRVCDKCFSEIQNCVDQNGVEHGTNVSNNFTQLMRNEGKGCGASSRHRTSTFFFQTPGEKSQNYGQANDDQRLSLLTSSLEVIIDSGAET